MFSMILAEADLFFPPDYMLISYARVRNRRTCKNVDISSKLNVIDNVRTIQSRHQHQSTTASAAVNEDISLGQRRHQHQSTMPSAPVNDGVRVSSVFPFE